jgi:hypothetical protein
MEKTLWLYSRLARLLLTAWRLGARPRSRTRRAIGREIESAQRRREVENAERLLARDVARAEKRAARGRGLDVYGSVARRAESAARAAAEAAKPVRSIFSAGVGFLNLRPIEDRLARREPGNYVHEFRLETGRSKRHKPARVARRTRKAKRGW